MTEQTPAAEIKKLKKNKSNQNKTLSSAPGQLMLSFYCFTF